MRSWPITIFVDPPWLTHDAGPVKPVLAEADPQPVVAKGQEGRKAQEERLRMERTRLACVIRGNGEDASEWLNWFCVACKRPSVTSTR